MDGKTCVVCRSPVTLGNSTMHRKCKHRTHNKCLDMDNLDLAQCASCKGEVDLSTPLLPDVEPGSLSGVDYVEQPLGAIGSALGALRKATAPLSRSPDNPHQLIKQGPQKAPVDWLIREKQLGLQRFLEERVTLDDFFTHGYTWDDLALFHDLSPAAPRERTQKALLALGANASHVQAKKLGPTQWWTPREMVEQLKVYFPDAATTLRCEGGYDWTAQELVDLGWRVDDLFGAGISDISQYWALEPTEEHDAAFGMTEDDFKALCPQPAARPVQQQMPVQQPVRVRQAPMAVTAVRSGPKLYHGLKPRKK